jgi:hypothetical protein
MDDGLLLCRPREVRPKKRINWSGGLGTRFGGGALASCCSIYESFQRVKLINDTTFSTALDFAHCAIQNP